MKTVLFVIAFEGFRDEELLVPKQILESKGFGAVVASDQRGTAVGKLGAKVEVEKTVAEVSAKDFDAVVFVGGRGVEKLKLYENKAVLHLARQFYKSGKITAAICIAPRILAVAGILAGKRATCFPDSESVAMLKGKGAEYEETAVVRDGEIITANGPESAKAFGEKMAKALAGYASVSATSSGK